MNIGILGAGQLAQMLALAGYPLGLRCTFLAPEADPCAAPLGQHLRAGYEDEAALASFAERIDVATTEFEHIAPVALDALEQRGLLAPCSEAILLSQERLQEKSLFTRLGLPTARYAAIDSETDLEQALAVTGVPAILKTRRMGYDGKGQASVAAASELLPAWEALGRVPCILEARVAFDREISVIAVRGRDGECRIWPLSENSHAGGILRVSLSLVDDPMEGPARDYCERLLKALDYVGVLALELFQCGDQLLVNEYAPRVHNSGHWTIEGAVTSQFENHLRAIAGLPLGSTAAVAPSVMVNVIGEWPAARKLLAVDGAHLHDYGKSPAPGRKLGHITLVDRDTEALQQRTAELTRLVAGATGV